jgi:hypothetical protein
MTPSRLLDTTGPTTRHAGPHRAVQMGSAIDKAGLFATRQEPWRLPAVCAASSLLTPRWRGHESETRKRSPEISSIAFRAQSSDLPPVSLRNMGVAIIGPLAGHRRSRIRFLFIGSRVCSTLPSDPPHDDVLALRYHFTSKLPTLLGVPKKRLSNFREPLPLSEARAFFRQTDLTR